jgi:hypothetical protein
VLGVGELPSAESTPLPTAENDPQNRPFLQGESGTRGKAVLIGQSIAGN